jgi:hypothetical protein
MARLALVLVVSAMFLTPAYGGWLSDAVSGAVQDIGTRAVNDATNTTYEKTREKAAESVNPQQNDPNGNVPPDQQEQGQGQDYPTDDGSGGQQ